MTLRSPAVMGLDGNEALSVCVATLMAASMTPTDQERNRPATRDAFLLFGSRQMLDAAMKNVVKH